MLSQTSYDCFSLSLSVCADTVSSLGLRQNIRMEQQSEPLAEPARSDHPAIVPLRKGGISRKSLTIVLIRLYLFL